MQATVQVQKTEHEDGTNFEAPKNINVQDSSLLGSDAVSLVYKFPTFRKIIVPGLQSHSPRQYDPVTGTETLVRRHCVILYNNLISVKLSQGFTLYDSSLKR